jgi:hypothetical protein
MVVWDRFLVLKILKYCSYRDVSRYRRLNHFFHQTFSDKTNLFWTQWLAVRRHQANEWTLTIFMRKSFEIKTIMGLDDDLHDQVVEILYNEAIASNNLLSLYYKDLKTCKDSESHVAYTNGELEYNQATSRTRMINRYVSGQSNNFLEGDNEDLIEYTEFVDEPDYDAAVYLPVVSPAYFTVFPKGSVIVTEEYIQSFMDVD